MEGAQFGSSRVVDGKGVSIESGDNFDIGDGGWPERVFFDQQHFLEELFEGKFGSFRLNSSSSRHCVRCVCSPVESAWKNVCLNTPRI